MYMVTGAGIDDTPNYIPGVSLRRVFYTVQLDDTHFVDVMISEESEVVYAMQNEDGSTVYDSEGNTDSFFLYSEVEALRTAIQAYEKEFGKLSFSFELHA